VGDRPPPPGRGQKVLDRIRSPVVEAIISGVGRETPQPVAEALAA